MSASDDRDPADELDALKRAVTLGIEQTKAAQFSNRSVAEIAAAVRARRRKIPFLRTEMTEAQISKILGNRMSAEHSNLNTLCDDDDI